jgi:hypothetical protein
MVLFIEHEADVFLGSDGDATRALAGSEFSADELAFDKELSIEVVKTSDIEEDEGMISLQVRDGGSEFVFDVSSLSFVGAGAEREVSEISGKPNSTGDDDVGIGPIAS